MHLDLDDFAAKFDVSDEISDIGGRSAHVGEDGRLMFSCEIYGTNEPDAGILAVAIDGQDLVEAHVPKELVPSFGWHKGVAAYKNGLIFLHRKTRPSEDETRATYLPREGRTWGTPQPLSVSPPLPTRTTSKGFSKQVMPASKGFGRGDIVAWPVEASTGSPETSVKSVAFFQPDIANGLLKWSYWPESPSKPGLFARLWKKRVPREVQDFIQPDTDAFATFKTDVDRRPNILSAVFDGTQLLITTDGATVIKKSGDRCASIASVQANGSVSQLYYEDFIRADRPDGLRIPV